ncbi:MAG: lysoplasmalogenase [Oscillospiraceae bacterium]|jgi:hypothetical protein|nr:lysoplasmalogenase [Oscillospiraceae bacterium]
MTEILAGIFTLCGVGTMTPYIVLRIKRKHVAAIILKVSTSVLFLLTTGVSVLMSSGAAWERYKFLFLGVLFGQISGLLGDYWLDMKDMHTKHHDTYVLAGFTSFLVGHLFFIAGLLATYGAGTQTVLFILGAGFLLCAAVLATEKPMKLRYGKFKGITAGYSAVFGMSIAAAFCSWYFGRQLSWFAGMFSAQPLVMLIGLVVFLLSDFVLSGTYFGEGKTRPIDYTLNYIFYYGGQFTIALSLLWIGGAAPTAPGA